MFVIELAALCGLRDRLRAALADICGSASPVMVAQRTHHVFQERNLLWLAAYDEFPKHRLADM